MVRVRDDNRSLSTKAIVRALVKQGQLRDGVISLNSVRRMYRSHGLERISKQHDGPGKSRLLVGLPELWDMLGAPINRSLWSRIHCRIAIPEPTPGDTAEYILHRISQAAGPKNLFSSDAIGVLHEGTLGHLRNIDRVATSAIKRAARGDEP